MLLVAGLFLSLTGLLLWLPGGAGPSRAMPAVGKAAVTRLAAPPRTDGAPLRVLTYNIRHGARDDRQVDLAGLADIIRESGADIVALQEVDRFQVRSGLVDQARWLAERLDMEAVFGANLHRGLGQYGNALLSRYPVLSDRNVLLPGRLERRGVLVVRVLTPAGPVTVLATHLGLSRDDRTAQVRAILAEAAREPGPVILLGDWNSGPAAPELAPLTDGFRSAPRLNGMEPAPTFRAGEKEPYAPIDHVFVSGAWEVTRAAVLSPQLSDHQPVLAELRLPVAGSF